MVLPLHPLNKRVTLPPLSAIFPPPSKSMSLSDCMKRVNVIVCSAGPQANAIFPPAITAERKAASVQLAAVPLPTTCDGVPKGEMPAGLAQTPPSTPDFPASAGAVTGTLADTGGGAAAGAVKGGEEAGEIASGASVVAPGASPPPQPASADRANNPPMSVTRAGRSVESWWCIGGLRSSVKERSSRFARSSFSGCHHAHRLPGNHPPTGRFGLAELAGVFQQFQHRETLLRISCPVCRESMTLQKRRDVAFSG